MKYVYTILATVDLLGAGLWLTRPGWGWVIFMVLCAVYFGVRAFRAWTSREATDGTD